MTWTLKSHFAVPRVDICAAIQRVIAQSSVSVDPVTLDAVGRYVNSTLDFVDCAGATVALPLVTYDRDYRKFKDVVAKRPGELLADITKPEGK